jgi:hypothetical protein
MGISCIPTAKIKPDEKCCGRMAVRGRGVVSGASRPSFGGCSRWTGHFPERELSPQFRSGQYSTRVLVNYLSRHKFATVFLLQSIDLSSCMARVHYHSLQRSVRPLLQSSSCSFDIRTWDRNNFMTTTPNGCIFLGSKVPCNDRGNYKYASPGLSSSICAIFSFLNIIV